MAQPRLTIFALLTTVSFCLLTLANAPQQATANDGFITDATASSAGLKVEWFSQVGVGAAGKLIDWQLSIDENQSTTYFVVTSGRRREVIAQNDLNAFGVPFGIEKAQAYANERKEIIDLENKIRGRKDAKVTVTSYTLPKSTIYVLSSDGNVTALDADTGRKRWTQLVGNTRLPSIGLGASKKYVAVVNGSRVYCLDSETGRVLWNRRCKFAVGASPACSDEFVFVPLTNGRLESFPIETEGVGSVAFVAKGEGTARPLVTEKTVSWPTYAGHLNVAPKDSRRAVSYRLKTADSIVASPTFKDGILFTSSLDGFVYGVEEENGRLLWEVSTGAGISGSPIPYGNSVFVVSDDHQLYKIDAKTGQYSKGWERPRPGIKSFVGITADQFFCLDRAGNLVGIDKTSGAETTSLPTGAIDLILPNFQTDRMFFGTRSGYIQCVRQLSSLRPKLVGGDTEEVAVSGEDAGDDAEADPFGGAGNATGDDAGESNPFGDSADMGDDESNPFGDSSDDDSGDDDSNPFGDDSSDDDSNPFGDG